MRAEVTATTRRTGFTRGQIRTLPRFPNSCATWRVVPESQVYSGPDCVRNALLHVAILRSPGELLRFGIRFAR